MIFGTRNGKVFIQDIHEIKNLKIYSVEKYESLMEPPSEMIINTHNSVILLVIYLIGLYHQ